MTDHTPVPQPWVLLRKGRPPSRFDSLDRGKRFFDQLRFNFPVRIDGACPGRPRRRSLVLRGHQARRLGARRRPPPPRARSGGCCRCRRGGDAA